MSTYRFDVIIIGAGPAGVAAAGALAGSGISVALIEAGAYAGAENWSGCVYFAESLAEPDCFGPSVVQNAPFERPVVRRGTMVHNGLDDIGISLTDPAAFRHCYTVLRPVYDPYFAEQARRKGAMLLTGTTVTGLIRKSGAVIGVSTDRGPLYGGAVFIAEGDASHLVRSEGLERVAQPHFLQGVKAVYRLPAGEIERRFGLEPGQGAAYEILVRNAAIAGRTARLNAGGFLYTNRDSLSFGYVLPLDNLARNYRGDHGLLLEWMRTLPHLRDLLDGAELSGYGAKVIRSGGWRERPMLVDDGLVVGGSSAGLGIDLPFPNFTGPAAASGLCFARAVRGLLRDGRTLDRKNLTREYLEPLQEGVHGRNARHLSRWPGYFGRSRVLFGRTADVLCGTARFFATGGLAGTGRFLRGHILSPRGLRELLGDTAAAISSLRLWKPLARALFHPGTYAAWLANQFRRIPPQDARLAIDIRLSGKPVDTDALGRPFGGLLRRTGPPLARAVAAVYANDGIPVSTKLAYAVRTMARSLRVTDLVSLPAFFLAAAAAGAATALWDAFRYFVLRTPAATMLAEPVRAYEGSLREARSLEAVKPDVTTEAKLAANTYQVGTISHIRTAWPAQAARHGEMARTGLWWLCPARVYGYDAPLFGRGAVSVNWENCIKCESCRLAEPRFALWGRFTDHRLIYRPRTAALPLLLKSLDAADGKTAPPAHPRIIDKKLWYLDAAARRNADSLFAAEEAFRRAVTGLPASADGTRLSWPAVLGERLRGRMEKLEKALDNEGRHDAARDVAAERASLARSLDGGRMFEALYCSRRFTQRLRAWFGIGAGHPSRGGEGTQDGALTYETVAAVFPDRVVKTWEEEPMEREWAERLRTFIDGHRHPARPAIRALASVSPALGLIAAVQVQAMRLLDRAGERSAPGLVAVDGSGLSLTDDGTGTTLEGVLPLVPTAAATGLLVVAGGRGYPVPFDTPGLTVSPSPAIGFRAAGLADVSLRCFVTSARTISAGDHAVPDPAAYLAIALGAGDYLSRRAREHAAGRIQFPGQMLDTGGRDGIAKLGAVKALIARVESWRLMLETLSDALAAAHGGAPKKLTELAAAAAAIAFGPENGCMAYDAGQVFGGFAYSEDDLLSRAYRDSSLFRFLAPGTGAAERLAAAIGGAPLLSELSEHLGYLPDGAGPPLAALAEQWKAVAKLVAGLPAAADGHLRGEAMAVLLGCRAVMARVEKGLSSGGSREAEAACAEVLLGLAHDAAARAALSAGDGPIDPAARFPLEPSGEPAGLDLDYAAFCSLPGAPHRSGAFLLSVFDRAPRYVPEMQLHDRSLRDRWSGLVDWFRRNCAGRVIDGLHFERAVERTHDIPPDVVASVRRNRWLATYIPTSEDGLGWRKADYYVLNSAAGSFGDAGICLLIMASTSIGTTPVLLGLEEELPRVREELEPLVRDDRRIGEIGRRVKRLVASFRNPNPSWIRKEYSAVMALVDSRIRHTRVVKYLAAHFLKAFYGAGIAGKRGDFGGFMAELSSAAGLIDRLLPDLRAALDELPRRERAHRLFLKMLGHGGVSAFALTEPTAGSDSGGVKTTASLRSAMLSALPDGRYVFAPTGDLERCRRYLIDADRIVFTEGGMAYRAPDGSIAEIRYDRFDGATGEGARYYEYGGAVCEFHDIGQVRETEHGLLYEYYSLTGAKMWITNGAIATQFSLYARAPEGVTAFMADRYAEGLKVGADERKMGQRGSPTNELSLDSVRVPREAVIGYEGHGQVNALETLNAGRCGLAVVAGALARKVLEEALAALPASMERDRLLGEAAAVLFGSESVAYYLIGLFDRPHESVRMESAVAKYLCAEDVHEILTLVERAYGPAGQTERFLLEKARRDSRILNIYEGTNEVQRFLILKDLVAMAAAWPELPERLHERPGDERAMTLARWKNRVRRHVRNAAGLLGDAAWADAMLQPALFRLSEMAGEVLRLECIWHRMEWLETRRAVLGGDYVDPLLPAAARAAGRSLGRLAHLDERFGRDWERIRSHRDTPEVVAADALLDRDAGGEPAGAPPAPAAGAAATILCILRPLAEPAPAPMLDRGCLSELVWNFDPGDLSGLEQALAIKASSEPVQVHVLTIGRERIEQPLRNAAGGADAFFRIDSEQVDLLAIARAVRDLEAGGPYDLVVCGAGFRDGAGDPAPYLSGHLGRSLVTADRIVPVPSVPAVAAISEARRPVRSDMRALLDAHRLEVTVLAPAAKPAEPARYAVPEAGAVSVERISTVGAAADRLKAYAAAERAASTEPFGGPVGAGALHNGPAAWALLDLPASRSNIAVLRAARTAAGLFGIPAVAFVAAPRTAWPLLLGLCRMNGVDRACCLDTKEGILSADGRIAVLSALVEQGGNGFFGGPAWNDEFGKTAGRLAAGGGRPRLVQNCAALSRGAEGNLEAEVPAYGGKLARACSVPDVETLFITVSDGAVLPPQQAAATLNALEVALDTGTGGTVPSPPEPPPALASAEVIIDIGYGVRDQAGMDLVLELKQKLEDLGLSPMLGATRKVTQDLKLLPLDAQIGQTGVRVNPKLVIALGISGAPQHVDWIGTRAEVLCFNKDPEAPFMKLNQSRPAPQVHPLPGDLFVTVRELIEKL